MFSKFFIERPIFAAVVAILIVLWHLGSAFTVPQVARDERLRLLWHPALSQICQFRPQCRHIFPRVEQAQMI